MISEYDYEDLAEKAIHFNATKDDLISLWIWFERYGYQYWNGECYEIDSNHYLYPIYEEDENGYYNFLGCEIR